MKKQVIVLFVLAALFFLPYFFKPFMLGYDSYFYLQPNSLGNEVIGAKIVFQSINGNVFAAKAFLFCCLLASVMGIGYLGKVLLGEKGWLAGALVFLSPIFLESFWYFEPEAIAYPILFFATAILFKDGLRNKIVACSMVCAATLFWIPSLIWLAAFSMYFLPAFIALIPLLPSAFANTQYFLPKKVQESAYLGAGVTFHWALLFFGLLGLWKNKMLKLVPLLLFFGALAFLNGKFGIFLAPVLAIGAATAWAKFPVLRGATVGILIAYALFIPIAVNDFYEPTNTRIAQVQEIVESANGQTICNNWTFGHMINYFGGHAIAKAGGLQPDCNKDCPGCPTFFFSDTLPA